MKKRPSQTSIGPVGKTCELYHAYLWMGIEDLSLRMRTNKLGTM